MRIKKEAKKQDVVSLEELSCSLASIWGDFAYCGSSLLIQRKIFVFIVRDFIVEDNVFRTFWF